MKKVGIILIAALLFVSCEEDILELFPEMSAEIDGVEWNSIARVNKMNDNNIVISGVSLGGETILLTINGTTEGTYDIVDAPPGLVAAYNESELADINNPDLSNAYLGVIGTVTLSEVNTSKKTLSGTFRFTATRVSDTKDITAGVFEDIKYTE
jgi:hypothetical protein